ncbi:4Fe-4S dicluster domain-containing protein [Desulfitobacterium sp. PCE1]|uniref:4Fe-4S dicluster domain-containing protein n=1 Tax=Desulfitobacterium sp. PCE1 TaxID=146907 RepID=UPI00036F2E0C|nr:4Fe-4S dicluster domain-containing protein [Desulfitobacterium sp. PCE1]
MGKKGFYFDMEACIGCRTCQIACKDKNNNDIGVLYRRVKNFETGVYPQPDAFNYSSSCNHCAEAKCVKGCPTGAMHYAEDGTVQHDKDKCIGCKYCIWNCPYGAPQFIEESGIVGKCDSCKGLRDSGENPACVDACIMRCLEFGDLDELKAKYGDRFVQELPILPSAKLTNPSVLIKPKDCALDSNSREKEV